MNHIADYEEFLRCKTPKPHPTGVEPGPMRDALFDYQRDCVAFCLRAGRSALFLDTGLGKGACILEWCEQAAAASNGVALIMAPLAVAHQFKREADKFGYSARVIREQSDVMPGINVCNYDRLDKLDPTSFGAVALDESSVLKNFSGRTARALIEMFAGTRFRLCATATPAPNDHMELGQHAEFLGIMTSNEMLSRWFINDTKTASQKWRLKKSAVDSFWDWMASWSRAAETPADLGFDASRFVLPELRIHKHKAFGDIRPMEGSLFVEDVSATNMYALKRETTDARADAAAAIVLAEPAEPWIVWCDTDLESAALAKRIPGAIEVRGSMTPEKKESAIEEFLSETRVLITKASMFGSGLNLQKCARVAYVGRNFSYESFYQSVRRCWRYGQTRPVDVHLIVAEGEDQIGRVIDRKAADHSTMKRAMAKAMNRGAKSEAGRMVAYNPTFKGEFPTWLK